MMSMRHGDNDQSVDPTARAVGSSDLCSDRKSQGAQRITRTIMRAHNMRFLHLLNDLMIYWQSPGRCLTE